MAFHAITEYAKTKMLSPFQNALRTKISFLAETEGTFILMRVPFEASCQCKNELLKIDADCCAGKAELLERDRLGRPRDLFQI